MRILSRQQAFFACILAVLLGVLLMPIPSYAEGTLEIDPSDNVTRDYSAWKLLDGDVSSGSPQTLSNVGYTGAISAEAWQELGAPEGTAQDVADWISMNSRKDLAVRIMWAVEGSGVSADQTGIQTGTTTLSDGYWLVSSDDSSPILVLVGGGQVTKVTEKAEAPALTKEVKTDGDWSQFAVAGTDLDPSYRLVGTIPSNYDSFPTYRYQFDDRAAEGLVVDPFSVKVTASTADGNTQSDLTGKAEVSVAGSSLTVTFDNLKDALPERGDYRTITVSYAAHLSTQATFGLVSTNNNEATLTYTRKPTQATTGASARAFAGTVTPAVALSAAASQRMADASNGFATTERQQCQVATWAVRILKTDAANASSLAGAGFTIQDEQGLYINTDGTATAERTNASVWRTDADGTVTIGSLPNGTFTLSEVEVPAGYEAAPDATVSLVGDANGLKAYAGNATVTAVSASTGIADVTINDSHETVASDTGGDGGSSAASGGILSKLPSTGDSARIAIGAIIVAVCAVAILLIARSKRKSKGNGRY